MSKIVLLITCILFLSFSAAFASTVKSLNSYFEYTYKNEEDNYHIARPHLSSNGSIGVAIAGTDVTASQEVIGFNTLKKIIWRFKAERNVFDVNISQDGSTAVACGSKVWLLNAKTGKLIWEYDDGAGPFDTCTISSDGKKVFSGSRGPSIFKWDKKSNIPEKSWSPKSSSSIDKVVITPDGKQLIAENDNSYIYIKDTNSSNITWEKEITNKIADIGISQDGRNGFVIEDVASSDNYKLISFSLPEGIEKWVKDFNSFHTPFAKISKDGFRITLSTNNVYYGLNNSDGSTKWSFERNGKNTSIDTSADGKFVLITEGLDYVYLFDFDYPEKINRPLTIFKGIFPGASAVSSDGSTGLYEHEDFTHVQFKPAILVDQESQGIYREGDEVKLRFFVSNPGKKTILRARVTLSLPQIAFLEDLGANVETEPTSTKTKLLEFVNETLPGFRVIDEATRTFTISGNSSNVINVSFKMPVLIIPNWANELLDFIKEDIIGGLLKLVTKPISSLIGEDASEHLVNAIKDITVNNVSIPFPLIGVGEVKLFHPRGKEIYSKDNFFFTYVAETSSRD